MCAGAKFRDKLKADKEWTIYFPSPAAALPIDRGNDQVEWMSWGRRNDNEDGDGFQVTGWARFESIQAGKWDRYQPEFVKLAVQSFMEVERKEVIEAHPYTGDLFAKPIAPPSKTIKTSHWFDIPPGKAIEALIAHVDGQQRLYVVTDATPLEFSWIEHDRWPRIVDHLIP